MDWSGIPMTEEQKQELEEDWKLIEESIEEVLKKGQDVCRIPTK